MPMARNDAYIHVLSCRVAGMSENKFGVKGQSALISENFY